MWQRTDVKPDMQYQVALCQSASGRRYYALCPAGASPPNADSVLLTEITPNDLLWWSRFEEISETVRLTNGERFFVEAHGVWFTTKEWEALDLDEDHVPWLNGLPPVLPPK